MSVPTVPASALPPPTHHPELIVLMAGVATSAATLWVVSLLADAGIYVMGWYWFLLVPVGALLVGLVSGLGYAMAARKVNMKLTYGFVSGMVFISLLDYFANHYVSYLSVLERVHPSVEYSFVSYLQDICETMTFSRTADGGPGEPIGLLGYLFKGLEAAGYVAGATIPAKMAVDSVASTPDCLNCRQYYAPERFGYLNAPEQWADVAELPRLERILAMRDSRTPLLERTEAIMDSLEGASCAEARMAVSKLEKTAAMGNTGSVTFTLRKCPGCMAFHLSASFVGYGVDGDFSSRKLRSVESTGLGQAA